MKILILLLLLNLIGCSYNKGLSVVQGRLVKYETNCNDIIKVTLDCGSNSRFGNQFEYLYFEGPNRSKLEKLVGKEVKFKFEDIRKIPARCGRRGRLWYAKEIL